MAQKHQGAKTAAGMAAMAAAAAGAYFFFTSPKAKSARTKTAKLIEDAKKEVVKELAKLKGISKDSFEKTVSDVLKKYEKVEADFTPKAKEVAKDLKGQWQNIEKHVKKYVSEKTATKPKAKTKAKSKKTTKK